MINSNENLEGGYPIKRTTKFLKNVQYLGAQVVYTKRRTTVSMYNKQSSRWILTHLRTNAT
jgi:hypothetical protein